MYTHPPEVKHSPWKMMVGRLLSFWDGIFSGAMLNFQRGVFVHMYTHLYRCKFVCLFIQLICFANSRSAGMRLVGHQLDHQIASDPAAHGRPSCVDGGWFRELLGKRWKTWWKLRPWGRMMLMFLFVVVVVAGGFTSFMFLYVYVHSFCSCYSSCHYLTFTPNS